jgi:uncharacterized protein (DUF433 family)
MGRGKMLDRITANPTKMGGVPCIRELRVPISTIIGLIADEPYVLSCISS